MSYYNTPKSERIIDQEKTYTLAQVVQSCILVLNNPPSSPFWYKGNAKDKFQSRFDHTKAKPGSRFYDGNNGDQWRVIAADTAHNRLIVQNLDQNWSYPRIVYWN